MKKFIILLKCAFTLLPVLLTASLWAQVIPDVQNSFNNYAKNAIQEKLFVHTDKTAYLAGEILWFKVYDVDAATNKPLDISKVAYVEILDNNRSAILQVKIALKKGSGYGSVYLPVSINNGSFKLRAYTNWMKNFGADYFFEKNITIINPSKSPDQVSASVKTDYDVQFFPEGGNLVSGIKTKVAFKVTGSYGQGVEASGGIIDQQNDTVARFRTLKFGIGSFIFAPAAGKTYKAIINVRGSKPIVKDLPAVNEHGYSMQLTDDGTDQLTVVVKTDAAAANIYLFAQTRQQIKVVKSSILNNGQTSFSINKAALGEGVSHLTIFDEARQPVCERLYFKRPQSQLMVGGNSDQLQYGVRKKVTVNLQAKDNAGHPLAADLSVSVYHLDSLQIADPSDIRSYLWLSADLRGVIQSPEYYLKNTDLTANEALDNLMLSQGWRRFKWNDVLNSKRAAFKFLPEYNGHLIAANITNTLTNLPATGVIAYLGVPGKRVQLSVAESDSSGHLLFDTRNMFGPGEIVAQTNTQKDSVYHIDILSPFFEQYSKVPVPPFKLSPDLRSSIESLSLAMQVQNIYSGNKTRLFSAALADSSAFYNIPDRSYKLDDFTRFTTMEEVLIEYVKEVSVSKTKGHHHLRVLSELGFLDIDPLVMVDGVPIFDIDKVFALDPLKMRKLEVIRNRYYWQSAVEDGILSFTSYKGDLGGYEIDPKAVVIDYEGLQQERLFYSPVYNNEQQAGSRMPDLRNLLYWSPMAGTDNSGVGQLSFYTSDKTGKYVGVVQGLSATGEAGSDVFTFEVKQSYTAEIKK